MKYTKHTLSFFTLIEPISPTLYYRLVMCVKCFLREYITSGVHDAGSHSFDQVHILVTLSVYIIIYNARKGDWPLRASSVVDAFSMSNVCCLFVEAD